MVRSISAALDAVVDAEGVNVILSFLEVARAARVQANLIIVLVHRVLIALLAHEVVALAIVSFACVGVFEAVLLNPEQNLVILALDHVLDHFVFL